MSKKDEIVLSEKYGLNPSMCQCFFCGEVKGIALMGHIGDKRKHEDVEAPKSCVMDYEPCDKCKKNMNLGITLIEVTTTQPEDNRPPMKAQGGVEVYPTGKFAVVTEEAASRIFGQNVKIGQWIFMDKEVFEKLIKED